MPKLFECDQCKKLLDLKSRNTIHIKDRYNRDTGRTVWYCPPCTRDFLNWELGRLEQRVTDQRLKRIKVALGTTNMKEINHIIKGEIDAISDQ